MSSTPSTPSPASPVTKTAVAAFTLEPPEVIQAVPAEAAREAVPLKPELQQQVDDQVLRFIDALANEDLHSEGFRSRLDSAFALGKIEYLYDTLHEDHPDKGKPRDQVLFALRTASQSFKYMGLVIVESQPADRDGVSRVLYLARIFRRGQDVSFVELAEFMGDGKGLRYRSGRTMDAAGKRVPPPDLTIASFQPDDR